jgi:uncharacterized protein YbjT (DUF2867 family)
MAARHVLIAGGSGVVGRAALDAFGGVGWEITTLSRHASAPGSARHVPADLLVPASLAAGAEALKTVTHLFYAALEDSRHFPPNLHFRVTKLRRAGFAAMNERADEVLLAHLDGMRAGRLIP